MFPVSHLESADLLLRAVTEPLASECTIFELEEQGARLGGESRRREESQSRAMTAVGRVKVRVERCLE